MDQMIDPIMDQMIDPTMDQIIDPINGSDDRSN